MNVILDLAMLGILGLCIWSGYKRGFFLSLAGVLVIILSLVIAGTVAQRFSADVADEIQPYIGWISDDSADEAVIEGGGSSATDSEESLLTTVTSAFIKLGLSEQLASEMSVKAAGLIDREQSTVRSGVSSVFTGLLTYIILFIVVFAISALCLSVIANALSTAFKLPVLNTLNKVGGISLGAIYGLMIIFTLTWFFNFTGFLIPQETLQKTWFVKLFMYINPLKAVLGL